MCGLAACGTTDVDPRGTSVAGLDLGKGELFWASLTASYHGKMSAEGDDEVIQAAIAMGSDACDAQTLDATKACAGTEAAGDLREIRCRVQCKPNGPQPGPTLAQATLFIGGRPVALQLDRAEIAAKP
ncbi:MAG TPA: hypothetical protein VFG23_19985 [Polyangia bacterium]|nr:hypothetical protein [Polyangia bacterium]